MIQQPIRAFALLPPRSSFIGMLVSHGHHPPQPVRTAAAHGAPHIHLSHAPSTWALTKPNCHNRRYRTINPPEPDSHNKYSRAKLRITITKRAMMSESIPNSSSSSSSSSSSRACEMEQEKVAAAAAVVVIDGAERLRSDFLQVLRSRRSPEVPLTVEHAKPVANPLYQDNTGPQNFSEAMESCPRADIKNLKDVLREENFYLTTEAGKQGQLPVLILSLKDGTERKPAVVFLHSTNKCKEWLRPLLEAYASRGYVAIAIDSRYHGERASNKTTYRDALISSWKTGDTMPFIFDTVWDLTKLADYLTQRDDIDPTRIGITGESLGGMHAWFAAFVDIRYAVAVPIIGVQGFRWAIDNDKWQGRVDSIRPLFQEAKIDLGKSAIDKEVVEKVWNRLAPGLASRFDSPHTIPAIAPRPLLILNGAEDPRCPLAGLEFPKSRVHKVYEEAHRLDKFKLFAQPGIGHQMTSFMVKEASDWFDKFLKQ